MPEPQPPHQRDEPDTDVPLPSASGPAEPAPRDFVAEYRRREREQQEAGQWHRLSGAGVEFAAAIGLGALAGWGIDRWLEIRPWGLIAGVAAGFVVGLVMLVRVARDAFR